MTTPSTSERDVAANLERLRERMRQAEQDCNRSGNNVTLIAVTKTMAPDIIRLALQNGQRVFGENRVQEAKSKWPELRETFPEVELHLIGPLQSNKVREALGLFDVIHSLDRESLASTLAAEIKRGHRAPKLLVQVNTGEEPQKAGVKPANLADFLARCQHHHGLAISGLMCIPPFGEPPSPHFALLAKLARHHDLPLLSMGMSDDFAQAIQLGATHVRVGSAIFGAR